MMNLKSINLLHIANTFIIISIAYYWFETTLLNPVAIGLAIVFGLHLFVAKKETKIIFPTIFIALNLFMFLALFSELSEFSSFNRDASIMLIVGCLYLGMNVLSGIIIIRSSILKPEHSIS